MSGKSGVLGNGQQRYPIDSLHRPGHSEFSVNSVDLRTIYLAALTQLVTLSGVIPGLLFNACAPKAAAEIPTAAERREKIDAHPPVHTQHTHRALRQNAIS